jgi:hypothetical protein
LFRTYNFFSLHPQINDLTMKELTLLILLTFLYVTTKRRRQMQMQDSREPLQAQIEMALTLAEAETASSKQAPKKATAADRLMLEEKGIKFDRKISEIEAVHLLGLFEPPSARQIDILRHFKLPRTPGMTKTQANYLIKDLFANPVNIKEWSQRPASTRVKQGILFMSGQIIQGVAQVEAQSHLMQLGMDNPLKYSEWKHIEKLFVAINDASTLEHYTARKITWRRFFQLYDALKLSGFAFKEIRVEMILKQAGMQMRSESAHKGPNERLMMDTMAPTSS